MRISEVVRRKGDTVVTIASDATVAELVELLAEHRIGAVVVSDADGAVDGIVSERDIVVALHGGSGSLTTLTVRDIMSTEVHTCTPDDDTETLARAMTDHRVRHMPVVVDGRLRAIVSIGDIVKQRLDELQLERDELASYVQQ